MLESLEAFRSSKPASIVCDFIQLYFLRHSTWLQLGIYLDIQVKRFVSSYDKYHDNFKIYICWLVRANLQNRNTRRVLTEVESGFGILKKNRDNPA